MAEDTVIVLIAEKITIWAGREAAVDAKEVSAETAVRPLAPFFAVWSAGIIMPYASFHGFKYYLSNFTITILVENSKPGPPGCFSCASHIRGHKSGDLHRTGSPATAQALANDAIVAQRHSHSPPREQEQADSLQSS